MNKFKIHLLLILALTLVSSNCDKKKNDPKNFHILKGRVMQNCTTPYASSKILLAGDSGYGKLFCEDINGNKEFYTDENGYFEIKYRKNGGAGILYAPYKAMSFIPIWNKNLDIGEVNLNGRVSFVIKLQVTNPYTANDTLIYGDLNNYSSGGIKLAGPFSSGIIDTVFNTPYTEYPVTYGKIPKKQINYFIKSGTSKSTTAEQPFCAEANSYGEAIFIID